MDMYSRWFYIYQIKRAEAGPKNFNGHQHSKEVAAIVNKDTQLLSIIPSVIGDCCN